MDNIDSYDSYKGIRFDTICAECGNRWGAHYGDNCDPIGSPSCERKFRQKSMITHFIDRSRIEADWDCPRKRYWMTEYQAKDHPHRGITPVGEAPELAFGTAMHQALATLAMDVMPVQDVAAILESALIPMGQESVNLGLGLFWAFWRTVWQDWLKEYDIVGIEKECFIAISRNTEMMLRPDLALRRKNDGSLWYPDFKTTGFKTQNWIDGWNYAIQLQTGCEGLGRLLNEPVEGAFVVGLYKGYKKDNLQRSPFTYIYKLEGTEAGVPDRYAAEWCRGWKLVPVNEYPGGVQAWVESLPETTLREQLPMTGPIPFDGERVDAFKVQQKEREAAIQAWHRQPHNLSQTFPQYFKSCRPLFGKLCAYLEACHSPSVNVDPVGSGLYKGRIPHHAAELQQGEDK